MAVPCQAESEKNRSKITALPLLQSQINPSIASTVRDNAPLLFAAHRA